MKLQYKMNRITWALVLIGATAGCAPTTQGPAAVPVNAPPSDEVWQLRPGDIIDLSIWRAPDITGKYQVDEDGTIVFPLLGTWRVVEDSPESLKRRLTEAYSPYFKNPAIDVTLLRRIIVLGSVNMPGLYPVDPTMTIADALAQAGGATADGVSDEVKLIRGEKVIVAEVGAGTSMTDLPIRSGDQLFVPERGWFSRYSSVVTTLISSSVALAIALWVR